MVLDEAGDLAAAGEAELAVELPGVVEAEDMLRLGGEELLRFGDEPEECVPVEDTFQFGDAVGLWLDRVGSGTVFGFVFFLELFWGFGD